MKKLAMLGILALSCLSIASAKSYDIVLASPTKAGSAHLKPGQYVLKIEGANAVFTNVDNAKSVTVPIKVESTETKYGVTRVDATKDNSGTDVIQDIELGGSKTKVEFSY